MVVGLALAVAFSAVETIGKSKRQSPAGPWTTPLTKRQDALLLLDRITFGPRPGDLNRVESMGLRAFLERQLHPDAIDDSAMDARLSGLWTLSTPPAELAADFPPPKKAQRNQRRERRLAAAEPPNAMQDSAPAMEAARPGFRSFGPQPAPGSQESMMTGAPGAGPPSVSTATSRPQQPQGPREILMQLAQEEMLRAVYSQRQLQEVMVRFWMNHFNIYWSKGADRFYLTSFEQNVLRPRALGNFEDLLVATAESPAMLFYLDNWMSVAPPQNRMAVYQPLRGFGPFGEPRPAQRGKGNRRGLNENYGREVMELHTIGLHYTQKDVTEVARCFTGWTIQRPGQGGGFFFNPRLHDYGKKVVLGHVIPAGRGIEDGFEVLHILATSPYTAQHIAYELCQRFVADRPPQPLVDRAAKVFLDTHGDIRSVLECILTSPEFYSEGALRAKVKSPFEYAASTLRAFDAQTDAGPPLLGFLMRMGDPMFMYEAPSGYADVAATWINSGTLLQRMNFAMALCLGRIRGTTISFQNFPGLWQDESPGAILNYLADQLMGAPLSPQSQAAILKMVAGDQTGAERPSLEERKLASLMIGSPEFQRR